MAQASRASRLSNPASRRPPVLSKVARFDEAGALKFLKAPKTSKEVRNLVLAYSTPDEFPTHRMLQELMMLDPMGAEHDQIMEIATLILPWCRDGNYGCLFDGTSNLSLTGKIAHFELGYIPESAKESKAAAGFLITNHARKHIMTLPRALRKRNVYEEVSTSPAARESFSVNSAVQTAKYAKHAKAPGHGTICRSPSG